MGDGKGNSLVGFPLSGEVDEGGVSLVGGR